MKPLHLLLLALLPVGILQAQTPAATPAPPPAPNPVASATEQDSVPELAALRGAYHRAIDANEAEGAKAVATLEKWYLDGLDGLLTAHTKAGDLDGALMVKAERERITAHAGTTAEQIAAMPPAMRTLRGIYEGSRKKISEEIARRNLPVGQKFLADLATLQKKLTVSGNLDQAVIVKAERERLTATLASSNPAPAAPPPTTPAPVGVQPKTPVPASGAEVAASDERNLLVNANFEKGTEGWDLDTFRQNGTMVIDPNELHDGKPALRVDNLEPCHAFVKQVVTVKPNTRYRLTGYIKTKDVAPTKKGQKTGAILMVGRLGVNTPLMEKTKPWTKVSVDFTTKSDAEIRVGPSLGTDATFATGTAWFADLTLTELGGNAKKTSR